MLIQPYQNSIQLEDILSVEQHSWSTYESYMDSFSACQNVYMQSSNMQQLLGFVACQKIPQANLTCMCYLCGCKIFSAIGSYYRNIAAFAVTQ